MKKILILVLLLLLLNNVRAQTLDVDVDKTIYTVGDEIKVDVIVKNDGDLVKIFNLEVGLDNVDPTANIPRFRKEKIELNPNEERKLSFSFRVSESYKSGEWDVFVRLISVDNKIIKEEKIPVTITGTKEVLDVDLYFCEDSSCRNKKRTFILGEDIFIDYNSNVIDLTLDASITDPVGDKERINLPISFVIEKIGKYVVELSATKEGYLGDFAKEEFDVIAEEAKPSFREFCNADNFCEKGENYQNCPQDCSRGKKGYFIGAIILFFFVVVYIITKKKKVI